MNPDNRKVRFTRRDGSFDPLVGSVLVTAGGGDASAKDPRVYDYFPPPPAGKLHYPSHPTIDSSMALTILLLLTAIFFMGFLSIYIRRFGRDAAAGSAAEVGNYHRRRRSGQKKGLDPEVVRSLPAYCYRKGGSDGRYDLAECAICLGEFVEEEAVKMIPVCRHVFHVQCVDTWLNTHVNCPLCRGTQFVGVEVEGGGGGGGGEGSSGGSRRVEGGRSTVASGDAWTVEMDLAGGLRRISSSSSLARKGQERISLPRTSSF